MRLCAAALFLAVAPACGGGAGQADAGPVLDAGPAGGPGVALRWAEQVGGPSAEVGGSVAVTSSGELLAVGVHRETATFGAGQENETELMADGTGGGVLFGALYGEGGALRWARRLAIASADGFAVAEVVAMTDGGFALAIGTSAAATAAPDSDAPVALTAGNHVLRFAASGDLVWTQQVLAYDLARLADDRLVAVGADTVTWLRADGEVDHASRTTARLDLVSARQDGGVHVVGGFAGEATVAIGEPEEQVLYGNVQSEFLASYGADGRLEAARVIVEAVESGELVRAITSGATGVIVVGDVVAPFPGDGIPAPVFGPGQPGGITVEANGEASLFAASYSDDGEIRWLRLVGGENVASGDLYANGVASAAGGAIMSGAARATVTFGAGEAGEQTLSPTPPGDSNPLLAGFDAAGSFLWLVSGEGTAHPGGVTAADGEVFVIGTFTGTVVFGRGEAAETALSVGGGSDLFIAAFGP